MIKNSIRRKNVDITFLLNGLCNYDCFYCCVGWGLEKQPAIKTSAIDPDRLSNYLDFIDAFDTTEKIVRISSYGETTLIPGIWEFISEVSARAKIVLVTNLSFDPEKLYKATSPGAIQFILTSLHPRNEEILEQFIRRCRELISNGYPVICHYMTDDSRIGKAVTYDELMKSFQIPYFISPIQDFNNSDYFPSDLKPETKRILEEKMEGLHPQFLLKYKDLAFTGMTCHAGYDMFCVKDKAIVPCMNSDQLLGWVDGEINVLTQPSACKATCAQAQCLPDRFLPCSRSYCMGDHTIMSTPEVLKKQISEFNDIYYKDIIPSRAQLHKSWVETVEKDLMKIHGKIYLFFFGTSIWPYLDIFGKLVEIEAVIISDNDVHPLESYKILSLDEYNRSCGDSELTNVIFYNIHGAGKARIFFQTHPENNNLMIQTIPFHP